MLNNKGYTIVEGIIAMLLVAIMVGGIFSALMASRRAIIEPSLKEEMLYTMESLSNRLRTLSSASISVTVCGESEGILSAGEHNCNVELPDVCKGANDLFKYSVNQKSVSDPEGNFAVNVNEVTITMVCNGETL